MDIVFVIKCGVLEVEPELYSKEKDAERRVKELCDKYDVSFGERHVQDIDVFWLANVNPDEKLQKPQVEEHDCLDYFEDTGDTEFVDEFWRNGGKCTKCGRKLTQVYKYQRTIDADTCEEIE